MRFAPEGDAAGLRVASYDATGIVIGGVRYTASVLLAGDVVESPWGPERIEALEADHVERLCALGPEVVLLGVGAHAVLPRPGLLLPFGRRGIGVEVMATGAACRTYNILAGDGRRVAALLLPIAEPVT
ncbi:MAG: MTH938/NDUFAF3 family protein [Gammaproteobacteria bacterium]|jgi:uncharacterized protein|nr:MTH938/NDUFAF3 family protein [Gammaproteobacteria bacterium]